jgi:hypothetical protein
MRLHVRKKSEALEDSSVIELLRVTDQELADMACCH